MFFLDFVKVFRDKLAGVNAQMLRYPNNNIEPGPAAFFPFDGVGFADAECNAYRRRSGFLLNAYLLQGGVKQKSTLLFVYFYVLTVPECVLYNEIAKYHQSSR